MKHKPITVLMLILLILSLAAVPAGAVDMVEPVGSVYAPKVTTPPTLDGVISEGEWNANAAFILSDWNMKAVVASGFFEVTEGWKSTFHLAWDNEYLYIAAETVDPDLCARIDGKEGDYYRMYFDFGPTVGTGAMNSTVSIVFCLKADENGDPTKVSLCFVEGSDSNVIYEPDHYGISVDKEKNLWIFEGKYNWSDISTLFKANTGTEVNPTEGMTATALAYYADFSSGNYKWVNWFGTTLTGYDAPAWFGPEEYGIEIKFVGADAEIPARPETTFPVTTEPPATSPEDSKTEPANSTEPAGSKETSAPTESGTNTPAATTDGKDTDSEKSSFPIVPVIIAVIIIVIAAIVAVIVIGKKKKNK